MRIIITVLMTDHREVVISLLLPLILPLLLTQILRGQVTHCLLVTLLTLLLDPCHHIQRMINHQPLHLQMTSLLRHPREERVSQVINQMMLLEM